MTARTNLNEFRGDLYEFQVRLLAQKILLQVQHELVEAAVGYSKDVVGVDHEYRSGSLAQVARLLLGVQEVGLVCIEGLLTIEKTKLIFEVCALLPTYQ